MYAFERSIVCPVVLTVESVTIPSLFFAFVSLVPQGMLSIPIAPSLIDNGEKDAFRETASRDS